MKCFVQFWFKLSIWKLILTFVLARQVHKKVPLVVLTQELSKNMSSSAQMQNDAAMREQIPNYVTERHSFPASVPKELEEEEKLLDPQPIR